MPRPRRPAALSERTRVERTANHQWRILCSGQRFGNARASMVLYSFPRLNLKSPKPHDAAPSCGDTGVILGSGVQKANVSFSHRRSRRFLISSVQWKISEVQNQHQPPVCFDRGGEPTDRIARIQARNQGGILWQLFPYCVHLPIPTTHSLRIECIPPFSVFGDPVHPLKGRFPIKRACTEIGSRR